MEVMTNHSFFDDDIKKVNNDGYENNREIVFKKSSGIGAILINKEDVVALAKEFDLIVYDKNSAL